MAKNNSLLISLVWRISLISIIAIAALSGIVYLQINRTLASMQDQTVQEQAKTVAGHLQPSSGLNKVFLDLPDALRQFYASNGDTYQYVVRDELGNRLYASPFANPGVYPKDFPQIDESKFNFNGASGRKFIGVTIPAHIGDKTLYVQAAQFKDASDIFLDEITNVFLDKLLWIGVPFYLCLLLVITWTLRRGLNPLHEAAEEAGKMSIADLSLRLREAHVPTEVLPLVRSVNSSYSRLEKSIQEQRELTEDIAHELRTPLTILKTRVDTLAQTDKVKELTGDIDAMIKQVNQMLDITRLEYADTMEMRPVDLAEVLSQCCQDFFPLFIKAQRELRVKGIDKPVYISGNKDLIYRAICNLLDNALEYSPSKTPVDAALENNVIKITDYGKKIPDERRSVIFERFQKDRSPSARKSGAGLGLSIVSKTMEVHGGTADLEETVEPRNTFRMIFKLDN